MREKNAHFIDNQNFKPLKEIVKQMYDQKNIKKLVANGRTNDALDALLELTKNHYLHNNVVLLKSQFSTYNLEKLVGIAQHELNFVRINLAILNLYDEFNKEILKLNSIKNNAETIKKYQPFSVFILMDTSKNVDNEVFLAMKYGLKTLISVLQKNPQAIETMQIGWGNYGSSILWWDFMPISDIKIPHVLKANENNETKFGEALELSLEMINRQLYYAYYNKINIYIPCLCVFVLTPPTDNYKKQLSILMNNVENKILRVLFCCFDRNLEFLDELTDSNIHIYIMGDENPRSPLYSLLTWNELDIENFEISISK